MDIEAVRTFLAIAELGSFTGAARRLHRSQPAISRRVELLEHDLGAPLLERLRGRARLTEAGRAFLPHAEAALACLRDGSDAVRGLQTGVEGPISLALVGTLADTHIVEGYVVSPRNRRMSGSSCAPLQAGKWPTWSDAARRRWACATIPPTARNSFRWMLEARPCWSWRRPDIVWQAAASGGPATCQANAGSASLRRQVNKNSGQILTRQLIRAGLDDADVILIDSLTAQKRLAQAEFGLALVPESSVRDELRQGMLVALDIPPMRTTIPITAVHRRNGYLSGAAKALLALLTSGALEPGCNADLRAKQ